MKYLIVFSPLFLLFACNRYGIKAEVDASDVASVRYEELTPQEFTSRLSACPVAYLPLGTLEMHGAHLPLGADGLQPHALFTQLAQTIGGIVLPMLFIGPDAHDTTDVQVELYGMDRGNIEGAKKYQWTPQQLVGSAYWVPDSTFNELMHAIMKQLSRAGFKIVVAHGHHPSVHYVASHAQEFREAYHLKVLTCLANDSAELCMQCDHAAANETSILMHVRPELVHMENLPLSLATWPLGVGGRDPRQAASKQHGMAIIDYQAKKMTTAIKSELTQLP